MNSHAEGLFGTENEPDVSKCYVNVDENVLAGHDYSRQPQIRY